MPVLSYDDLDLEIERTAAGYHARIRSSTVGEASTDFTLPFSKTEQDDLLQQFRKVETSETAARTIGSKLFNAVFGDVEMRVGLFTSLYAADQQGRGLRVRLRLSRAAELMELPWEFLYYPKDGRFLFLSVKTPLVRYIDILDPIHALTVKPPLRMLVMISSPPDWVSLDVKAEWDRLNASLGKLQQDGLVALEQLEDGTLTALTRRLAGGQYHIFHFIGHGLFDKETHEGRLLLTDSEGMAGLEPAQKLAEVLQDHVSLRLAVLNACEGARTWSGDTFRGSALSLVQAGIPAVIAMQSKISDRAAVTFSRDFYGALAQGYPVDGALAEARKTMHTDGEQLEWATPVLYMRAPDGRIFDIQVSPADVRERRRREEENKRGQVARLTAEAHAALAEFDYGTVREKAELILQLAPGEPTGPGLLEQAEAGAEQERILSRARAAFDAGRQTEAIELLSKISGYRDADEMKSLAERREKQARAHALAGSGETDLQQGKYDEALADFTRAIELDERMAWAIAGRGETYRLLGKRREALADLGRAIQVDGKDAFAFASRGEANRQSARYEEALADFNRAIELDEKYAWAIARRGQTYLLMGKFEESQADLNRAIELETDYARAIARRGQGYRETGNHERALADLYRALQLDEKNRRPRPHETLANGEKQL